MLLMESNRLQAGLELMSREREPSQLLDAIPSAEEIRERIAQNIRETRILRSMLRIAVEKERCAKFD